VHKTESSKQILELIPRIMRLIRTEMRGHAQGQLTIPQLRILLKLTRTTMTHREVAEWMGITPATLTRMVDVLVHRKLATRKTDPSDRRQIHLTPTALGKKMAENYMKQTDIWIQKKVEGLSIDRQNGLLNGLSILAELFPEE